MFASSESEHPVQIDGYTIQTRSSRANRQWNDPEIHRFIKLRRLFPSVIRAVEVIAAESLESASVRVSGRRGALGRTVFRYLYSSQVGVEP